MPQDEEARVQRLRDFGILDTPSEQRFDRITRMAAELLNTPIALVSLIDSERQWFKSKIGLYVSETPRSLAFCAHAIEQGPNSVMVVEDATADTRFSSNPLVTGEPKIRFYAGATLTTSTGDNLGTLCVIDRVERPRPSDKELNQLRDLAAIAVDEMELTRKIREADRRLAKLKLSEAMSGVGFWRFDAITSQVVWSDLVYAVYGVSRDTFDPNLESALGAYHPEDRPILEGHIARALTSGEGFSCELRIKRSDGEWRRVTAKAVAETDSAGTVIALSGVIQDLTDIVQVREAVATSEARYRLLAEAVSDVVLKIDVESAIEYASPSMRQFGWQPEALVGQRVTGFIHPADVERVGKNMAAVLAGGVPEVTSEQEFRIRKADGDFVWVEARRSVVRNDDGSIRSLVSHLRDITERHEATAKLAASEARYRMIADNTTDIIGRVSLEGVILYVSPAIHRLTGYTVEEMVGHKSNAFTHPEDIAGVVAAFREVMAGRPLPRPARYRIRHKHAGEWIWVEANPRIAVGPDGTPEFIDIMRDVRTQVALEQSMLRAMSEAEAGNRAKADFLANMSHEIRTPLNSIVGYAALLASSPDMPGKHRRYADVISASSKALIRIVDDVLDFSALDGNEVSFDLRAFDLGALVRATAETLRVLASAKQVDLRVSVDPHLPSRLLGDDARIRQVLMNLLGNAIKFTGPGRVEVRCERVSDSSGQTLRCAVEDTGIGIAANKLDRIFSRFHQADTTISRRYGGSGLGLAITQKIVTAMGGSIGVSSVEGVGSTFWFTLPLPAADPASGDFAAAQSSRVPANHKRRILLVDDHDINRELGAILLTPLGHEVVLAASGDEAVRLIQQEAFDLVLMDVQMPEMSGIAATRAIRALDIGKSLPIVALTAHAMRHQVEECLKAGMDGHVAKPFSAQTLQSAISTWAMSDPTASIAEKISPGAGLEIVALRDRFVTRTIEDADELRRLVDDMSPVARDRMKALIHRLAGTAGSLGFDEVGNVAMAIDAGMGTDETLERQAVEELLIALSRLH